MNPTSETGIWAYFSYFLTVFLYISAMQKKYQFSKVRFPHSEIDQNLILRSLGGAGGQKCLVHFDKYKKRQKYKHKDKYKDRYTHTNTEKYQIHNHKKIVVVLTPADLR